MEQAEEMEPLFHKLLRHSFQNKLYPCCNGSTVREILVLLYTVSFVVVDLFNWCDYFLCHVNEVLGYNFAMSFNLNVM